MNDKKRAIISIVLAALFVGGTGAFSKIALFTLPPIVFTFFRFFVGSIVVTPFFLKEKRFPRFSHNVILLTAIQVINPIIYAFGVRLTTATISQTLFSAAPILSALFSYVFLKEMFGIRKITGILIGFIGTAMIILLPVFGKVSSFNGNVLGNLLVFTSVVCLALYSTLSKKFHSVYSPLFLTVIFIYGTAVVSGILSMHYLFQPFFWKAIPSAAWVGIGYVGTFGIAFFLLYQYAVKHGSPTIASMSQYLSPVVAFIYAYVLLGERLTFGFVIGVLLALCGVFLVTMTKFNLVSRFQLKKSLEE